MTSMSHESYAMQADVIIRGFGGFTTATVLLIRLSKST
jgi:hypothetical protein